MSTGNYADINGIKMYYEVHGEGKHLVLIHGGGSTIESNWSVVLPLFAKHYQVIAVELQNHGHSGQRQEPETFEQDADDVAALLKHLYISKAFIAGFSNGASTTMQIAMRYAEIVDKIIIISGAYLRDGLIPGFFGWMENASLDNMPMPIQEAFLKINPDRAALQNMHDKDANRMRNFKDWDDRDLQNIIAPVLIINGDKDVILTEHALKMRNLIPNAELVILPGVHGACVGEVCTAVPGSNQPEITVMLIKEFLDK